MSIIAHQFMYNRNNEDHKRNVFGHYMDTRFGRVEEQVEEEEQSEEEDPLSHSQDYRRPQLDPVSQGIHSSLSLSCILPTSILPFFYSVLFSCFASSYCLLAFFSSLFNLLPCFISSIFKYYFLYSILAFMYPSHHIHLFCSTFFFIIYLILPIFQPFFLSCYIILCQKCCPLP